MLRMPSDSNFKRLRIIAFSLVMVLVPFVVYYYFYVSNQTRYFTGRDLRVLAALSRHVEESIESQSEVFKNAVKKYLADLEAIVDEDDGEQIEENRAAIYQRLKDSPASHKQRFQRRALDPLKGDGSNLTVTSLDVVDKPSDEGLLTTPRMEIKQEENQRWLYFGYTIVYPLRSAFDEDPSTEGKGLRPIYLNFKVKTNLSDLVRQFIDKRQIDDNQGSYEGDGFDAIVLAEIDDAVDVIFLESSAKLRIASLNNLTAVPDGTKVDLKLLGQSTNMADVKVGAGEYKLFFQPIQLPLAKLESDGKKQINWLACGFVESGRFRRESWSVSYTVLIVFGFFAVLVALSWPFLKLLLIGPKDRFRPIDTFLLVVSAVMITALLTFFAAFSYSYLRTEQLLDSELEAFSGSLQDNFIRELSSALQEIDDLNCHPKLLARTNFRRPDHCGEVENKENTLAPDSQAQARGIQASQAENALPQNALPQNALPQNVLPQNAPPHGASPQSQGSVSDSLIRKAFEPGTADRRRILTEDLPKHYPYFMSAFWADRLGNQRVKWTIRQNLTNRVPVAQREYFYKLREGQPYKLGSHEFYLQPITSRTTGHSEVIISKAIVPYSNNQMWISAIGTRLLSLMQPVVPSGFGYAIIDDAGKVLFHSEEKQHLGENFFEESDNNQALRAAVLGRSKQSLTSSYLGKGHSMYVRPIGQFGWTVVVFRNKDYLRTTFSEILTLCLVLFFSYLLAMVILILAVYLVNRTSRDRATWLWPAPDKIRVYTSLMLLNVVLTVASVAAVRWLPALWKIVLPVGIAFAAVLLFVWILKRTKGSPLSTKLIERLTRRSLFNHRTVYIINATLLFGLISIIPAYACFKLAYFEEMKLFIKDGQLNLARSLADREERLRAQYLSASVAGIRHARMEEFLNKRLRDVSYDVYANIFFQSKLEQGAQDGVQHAAPHDNKLIRFFKKFVPLFNQSSIERHALMWPAADNSWRWEEPSANQLVLHVEGALTTTQRNNPRHIVSTLPSANGAVWWTIWPFLLAIVALLVAFMTRHIFLFKRNETTVDELADFCVDSVSQNLFLVLNPPFIGKQELLKRLGLDKRQWERIDIGQSSDVERWFKGCEPNLSDCAKPNGYPLVILDNFDFAVENSTYNQQRLTLLEKLHELRRVAIAVSNLDPDRFMQTNGKSDASAASENLPVPVITERWTGAVSRFLKITLEDIGDPEAFRGALRARKRDVLADETLDAISKEQVDAVFETIERECSPRACLQSIGEGIANQRNISRQTPATVVKQVLVQSIPYYNSIWRACSDDEKLTLSHLSKDGLLSSNDPDTDRLMKKGLIVREPAIKLMNESFKAFVASADRGDALAQCEEKARKSSNWEVLKVPLTIGVASVIGFLLLTQREVYNSALPLITALTAGVPSFFKLISLFHSGAGGKSGD